MSEYGHCDRCGVLIRKVADGMYMHVPPMGGHLARPAPSTAGAVRWLMNRWMNR